MRGVLLAAALCMPAIVSPAVATSNVSGTVQATFVDPQPTSATYTGIGTNQITWGDTNVAGGTVSSMAFDANTPFSALVDQQFKIGSISYTNGVNAVGSVLTSIGLNLAFNFTDPALGATSELFTLGLNSTPNTGDPDADADYVYLPSLVSSNTFNVNGQKYTFDLLGFKNVVGDGFLSSTANEFHVREGSSASADLFGVVTAAVPEPASWAMMIVGFGAVGSASRYRRNKTNLVVA